MYTSDKYMFHVHLTRSFNLINIMTDRGYA